MSPLIIFAIALTSVTAVYLPPEQSGVVMPPRWNSDPSVWETEVNVTIPIGGWDGHWTQYPQFVDGLKRLASVERRDCGTTCPPVRRLPEQLTPYIYRQLYHYAVVEFEGSPPSFDGKRFETFQTNNGFMTCVVIKPMHPRTSRDPYDIICSPTNGKVHSRRCHFVDMRWHHRFTLNLACADTFVMLDFGNDRCYDTFFQARSSKLLIVNSNVMMKRVTDKSFLTLVHSRLHVSEWDTVGNAGSIGLFHLTQSSELISKFRKMSTLRFWKVLRLSDNSRVSLRQRGSDSTTLIIGALVKDNTSFSSIVNVNVSSTVVSDFHYVQETYDYLMNFCTEDIFKFMCARPTWRSFEYPSRNAWWFTREPCPPNSTFTAQTRFAPVEPACIPWHILNENEG